MTNEKIRKALERNDMYVWELSNVLGVSESTISRWIRHEMPHRKQDEIVKKVEDYAKAKD